MPTKITEDAVEQVAIELLEKLGYSYLYGPAIAPDEELSERASFSDVILRDRLRSAIDELNPKILSWFSVKWNFPILE